MRAHRLLTALIATLALTAAPAPAGATTVLQVDVPEMTRLSEWIIQGRVTDITYVDLREEGKGLFTDVGLDVVDVFKGRDVPSHYVMRLVGGRGKDGLALTIPGMPVFGVGQRVVLFLEKTNIGHVPCGLGQGVWSVHESNASRPWVEQTTRDLHMMRQDADGKLAEVELVEASWGMPLIHLVEQIYAVLDQPDASAAPPGLPTETTTPAP